MARIDKSARINAAVDIIKRGEFIDFSNTAKKYKCDHATLLRRVRGLTKSQKEYNSFYY
jgi:hypothetical protein